LTRAGHEIIFAQNGIDALAKLTQVGKNLSLIITDVAMPEMDGIEFAGLARQLHPNLPIVVVSGRFDQSILEKLDELSIHQRLQKPFTARQLKEAVQLVLHRSENLT
jgi:two-component system cell cycle sensor histidine kinase/response regulator CckA